MPTMTNDTVLAELDKDHYAERYNEVSPHLGRTQWTYQQVLDFADPYEAENFAPEPHKTRWRMKDDDGEIYYGGWLYNDGHCVVQDLILKWGTYDSGCTTIEVKIDDEWKQEIG